MSSIIGIGKAMDTIRVLAGQLGEQLAASKMKVTTAESCTGGGIAQAITMIPGSSSWFELGFVTYSNRAKQQQLAVDPEILLKYGAVSEEVVTAMVSGALRAANADVGIAVSGIAGPDGGSVAKPVGSVWFAWQLATGLSSTAYHHFSGDRETVRHQSVQVGLMGLHQIIQSKWRVEKIRASMSVICKGFDLTWHFVLYRSKNKKSEMKLPSKIIKPKLGLLELAKQLDNVEDGRF